MMASSLLSIWFLSAYDYMKTLYIGTEVGEAGHHLYHAAHLTVLDGIVQAVARFATVHLLVWIGVCHHPSAGVHLDRGHLRNHNLQEKQAKITDQGLRLEALMEGKAWCLMEMALLIQAKNEMPNSNCSSRYLKWAGAFTFLKLHILLFVLAGIGGCYCYIFFMNQVRKL